jgi:hypothetical protein
LDHPRPAVKKKQFGSWAKTAIRAEAHSKSIEIQGLLAGIQFAKWNSICRRGVPD